MRLMYPQCAAIDVHKKTAVVCRRQTEADGTVKSEVKTFGTTTPELLQMMDWLTEWEVTTVAIESTAEYWKPVFKFPDARRM
jgi:transposase